MKLKSTVQTGVIAIVNRKRLQFLSRLIVIVIDDQK